MVARSITFAVAVALCAACKSERSRETAPTTVSSATDSATLVVPPTPAPRRFAFGVATYDKDTVLDECLDFAVTYPPGSDAGPKPDWKETIAKGFQREQKREVTVLSKPCTEQFSDRTALATCTTPAREVGDAGSVLAIVDSYYNVRTLGRSDAYMKQCLDSGGDWKAIPHDSEAYRAAQRAQARRNAEKTLEQLQQ